ncbi:MAG: SigB/SigF/SigG family RNA polymerase sigma factor [Bacilli bacterium]
MARHKVEISNVNTSNIKVLTNNEMTDLFIKLKKGDIFAKDDLVNGNLKLVLSILRKYMNRCDNMDDLFQVGCIGLIKAIDNFDLKHEVKFSTYAVPMILGEIKRYLRDNTSYRVSRSIKDLSYQILRKKEELIMQTGKEPSKMELAISLGITEFELANALDSMKETLSMFEPIYNDGSDTIYLCDQLEDKKDKLFDIETKISLKEALKHIKEKEKYILLERYIFGKTQMELSTELSISQAQISRLEKSGIESIKKQIL